MNKNSLDSRSKNLRELIIRAAAGGKRGHLGGAFSLVEILRVLYDDILRYQAKNPHWEKRDRLIFSKGHGCLALYAILADKGFFPKKHLDEFCHHGALLGGHPEHNIPGVEASTGSLGHGLPIAVGMAISGRFDKLNHKIFVITGDGELDEGSVWEAALCARQHKLDNLVVIVDYNKMQSYATTKEVCDLEPLADKWRAFGFAVKEVDGHSVKELQSVLKSVPFAKDKPAVLICHTVKGKGIKEIENKAEWHHKRELGAEEITALQKALEEY